MKKFKKILIVLMVGVMFTVLTGCGGPKPSQVVDSYLKLYNDDSEEGIQKRNSSMDSYAKMLVSIKNREMDKYDKELLDIIKGLTNDVLVKMTYKINSEKIDKDTATVNVTVKRKDIKKILEEVEKATYAELEKAFENEAKANRTPSNDELMKKYLEIYRELGKKTIENAEETSVVGDIQLSKKDRNWVVNENKELNNLIYVD